MVESWDWFPNKKSEASVGRIDTVRKFDGGKNKVAWRDELPVGFGEDLNHSNKRIYF